MKEVEVILATKKAKAAYNKLEEVAAVANTAYNSLEEAIQAVDECQSNSDAMAQYYEQKINKLQRQMFWGFLVVSAVYAAALTVAFLIVV